MHRYQHTAKGGIVGNAASADRLRAGFERQPGAGGATKLGGLKAEASIERAGNNPE